MARQITPGCLVTHEEKVYRVLDVHQSGKVTLKSVETDHSFQVSFTDVKYLEIDNNEVVRFTEIKKTWLAHADSNPKELRLATERAKVADMYLNKKISRDDAKKQLQISDSTFIRILGNYDPELGAMSLLRGTRGRKEGARYLSDIQEEVIQKSIKRLKKKGVKVKRSELYELVDSTCHVAGVDTPSMKSVINRLESLGVRAVYSLEHGREPMHQKFDLKPGMINVETILSMVQIDHTKVDLIIVGPDGRPLMRPWLTVVIDLKSRVLLGYYLALHPPSAISVAMAFVSACYPKEELPISMGGGENTKHRFWGKPLASGSDNASEFTSEMLEATLRYYGIEPVLRPIGKKHYGGHVERIIGTFMGKVQLLPGTTYSNSLTKGEYDAEAGSLLTFPEFCKWFSLQVEIYHGRAHEGLNRLAPSEVWDIEMAKKGSDYVQPMLGDIKTFALDFFPQVKRTVQTKGVEFLGEFYASLALSGVVGQRLVFKYNPLNLKVIWWRRDGRYIELTNSDITKVAISYSEHWAFNRQKSRRAGDLVDDSLHQVRLDSYELIDEAAKRTKRQRQQALQRSTAIETMGSLTYESQPVVHEKPLSPDQTRKKLGWERW